MSSNRGDTGGLDKETKRRMTIALCDQPVITQLVDTGLASKLKRQQNKQHIALEQQTEAKAKARFLAKIEENPKKGDVTLLYKMDFDDITYARNEAKKTAWQHHMASIGSGILKLASKYCNNQPCYAYGICGGAFNYCIRVAFDADEGVEAHWMMRFPIPGAVMYPEAKVRHEVAVMKYLYEKTSIPVPKIIAWGTAEDNIFEGVGPFIIMEFVEGESLYEVLRGVPLEEVFRKKSADEFFKELARKAKAGEGDNELLSPEIDDATLEIVYRQIANVYLELSEHNFDQIGSLEMIDGPETTWKVSAAPYTNLENELERVCGVPKEARSAPYHSTADFISSTAQQRIQAMHIQRNSVDDVDFGREAYVARHLFRGTVPTFLDYQNWFWLTLNYEQHNSGPFKLVCDDFRPGNILVDRNLRITAICDWEWTYAAPYQQLYTAPRWLLLRAPEEWRFDEPYDGGEGEDDMLKAYAKKLDLFLKIMEEEEYKHGAAKLSSPQVPGDPDQPIPGSSNTPVGWFHSHMGDGTTTPADESASVHVDKPFTPTHTPVEFMKPESEPISSLMRKSFTNGQFWFNECLRAYNFELLYWLRLHDLHYGPKTSIEDCVNDWTAIPMNRHIEGFIDIKLKDSDVYQKELAASQRQAKAESDDGDDNDQTHEDTEVTEKGTVQDPEVAAAAIELGKAVLSPTKDDVK